MVDRVLSEVSATGDPFVPVIDDLQELNSAEAAEQLTSLLTRLPPTRAIVATRRDPPLRLHRLRLAGSWPRSAPQLRFTEEEPRQLVAAAAIALPDELAGTLHQRTEGLGGRAAARAALAGRAP